jgi:myo-inositol-1(or 4)-monophosphatase
MKGPEPEQARAERGGPATPDLDALLAHVTSAARHAADLLVAMSRERSRLRWTEKSGTDFVSEADLGSEARLRERLLSGGPTPGVPDGVPVAMRAEEGSPHETASRGLVYVADPLDGTTNFLHGFPWYAVSVGALLDGEPVVGVVLNVATGELFEAARGRGATRNGEPIGVSTITDPRRALLGTGFPFSDAAQVAPYLTALPPILTATAGIRRAGAAALDLCDVACGRFEAFWELRLAPWDFAAGALIAREAGARVTDMRGAELQMRHSSMLAGNPAMHAWLLPRLEPSLAAAT